MVKKGFINSTRGGQGGYRVIAPDKISVANVILAIDNLDFPKQPLTVFQESMEEILIPIREQLIRQLQQVTITDLVNSADRNGVSRSLDPILNYAI